MKKFALPIVILIGLMIPEALTACASAKVDPRAASFTSELVSCVAEAGTREQSRSCREAVEAKYADGGAK